MGTIVSPGPYYPCGLTLDQHHVTRVADDDTRDLFHNPQKAALKIEASFPSPGKYHPRLCIQCGKCAESCPQKAIQMNRAGAYIVDKELCNNCGICISHCKTGVIFQHPSLSHVIICDLCFACARICNTSALMIVDRYDGAKKRVVHG